MKKRAYDFKQQALGALRGNWFIAIIAGLIASLFGGLTFGGGGGGSSSSSDGGSGGSGGGTDLPMEELDAMLEELLSNEVIVAILGIVAIFVFIIALTGGLSWFKDKNSNTYANIPLNKRPSLKLLIISIPTVIAMLSGYLSLLLAGICSNYLYELFTMFAYGLLCIIVTYILSSVVNEHIYCGLIPVFILGSIICCPIFFNLANLIPAMKYLQNIFLPTYYFMF